MRSNKLDYHQSVDYELSDPIKILAQAEGKATAKNMPPGFRELDGTRGESAYVFDMGSMYGALVQEGLGTKSLVAQDVYKTTGNSFFANIAQDTVATIINDLISVGATPVVLNAYWSSSSYAWLADTKLANDFIKGWRRACDKAKVAWGGGETQSLPGVIKKGALEFAGSGFGVIKPKTNIVQDKNLRAGDVVLLLESGGVHANGISLIREIATKLDDGYQTKLSGRLTFGEAVLSPTILYAEVLQQFAQHKLDIHYLSNITGHGWRKLMRGTPDFTYVIEQIPSPQPVFRLIQHHSGNSLREMYANYNMGAGYAVYLPDKDAVKAQEIAKNLKIKSWIAGYVKKGSKKVVIEPLDLTFSEDTLKMR